MQLWSLITPLDLLLQGGSCCTQFFWNTEEGFHTNICTSTDQYCVTDTIAQLIDWTFPLVIENQFEENNWLITVIDCIARPYFLSTLETWVPCWRPVSQTFLLHLNYLCSKNHLRKNRYFEVTPVYMKASVLKSAMPMTRSWDGRDVSSCFQLKGRRRLCEYAFLPFWSIWGIHYFGVCCSQHCHDSAGTSATTSICTFQNDIQWLENCLLLWRNGNISQLLTEGKYI